MKEVYETPEVEIIQFETEDVIANSTPFEPYSNNW